MRVELYGCPVGAVQGNVFRYYLNENYKTDILKLTNDLSSLSKGNHDRFGDLKKHKFLRFYSSVFSLV